MQGLLLPDVKTTLKATYFKSVYHCNLKRVVYIFFRLFGSKVIKIKPCLKVFPKLLEDRDKNVRDETKQLCIELYRWIGAALKPQMAHFKPVLVSGV